MLTRSRFAVAALFTLCATLLFAESAGAPLKGVDVKLGRNPGNAARTMTTDENGVLNLGTLEKGSYFLVFAAAPKPSDPVVVEVKISGAAGKPITYRYNRKSGAVLQRNGVDVTHDATERRTSEPEKMVFESDGVHPMNSTVVRSRSNITNN